jgi:hypothetical protein
MSEFTNTTDILCPSTNEVCPALTSLRDLYVGNEDSVEPDVAALDRRKFTLKRLEYVGACAVRTCDGVTEQGTCEIRDRMNISPARKNLVGIVRSLRNH